MQRRNYFTRKLSQPILIFITVFLIASSFTLLQAQNEEEEKPSLNTGTIEEQFDYMVDKSSNYEEYKVIRKTWVSTFRSHFADSLKEMRGDIGAKQGLIRQKDVRIDSLNAELQRTREELQTAKKSRDSLTLLGIRMNKSIYNAVMWTLIAAMIAALIVSVGLYKRSNRVTVQTKKDLNEVREEFEEHRRKAREQMELVKRKHLDEINKLRNSH